MVCNDNYLTGVTHPVHNYPSELNERSDSVWLKEAFRIPLGIPSRFLAMIFCHVVDRTLAWCAAAVQGHGLGNGRTTRGVDVPA